MASVASTRLAWTLAYRWAKGGHQACKPLFLAFYLYGVYGPMDRAQHLMGASYATTEALCNITKVLLAHVELYRRREAELPWGTLEFDATRTNVNRGSTKVKNTHCGRVLVVHRETQSYSLEQLPDKKVRKGAPPEPEAVDEFGRPCGAKRARGTIV